MPDMNPRIRKDVNWDRYGTLPAGSRVVIVLNPTTVTGGTVVFDQTVPVGKKAQARIALDAEILDA